MATKTRCSSCLEIEKRAGDCVSTHQMITHTVCGLCGVYKECGFCNCNPDPPKNYKEPIPHVDF